MANLAKEGKQLTDLIADLQMPEEERELRLRFTQGCDFKTLGKQVIDDFAKYAQKCYYTIPADDNQAGFRLHYDDMHGDGWALLRMSLHDPILPINIESDSEGGSIKIVKDLYYFLKNYPFLDISPLQSAMESWRQDKKDQLKEKFEKGAKLF